MKLIVGLGNPGKKYENTRHNVGYRVVDKLGESGKGKEKSWITTKTQTYMNESGQAVKRLITNHHSLLTDLYIVHDDLDISLGQFKIQFGKGPKDHNGIASIEDTLGTNEFWRVRVGIENRGKGEGRRVKGEEYVLEEFTEEEKGVIDGVIGEIVQELNSKFKIFIQN